MSAAINYEALADNIAAYLGGAWWSSHEIKAALGISTNEQFREVYTRPDFPAHVMIGGKGTRRFKRWSCKAVLDWRKALAPDCDAVDLSGPLDQKLLRALVDYDGNTGLFEWRTLPHTFSTCNHKWNEAKAGKKCGIVGEKGYAHISLLGKKYKAHRLAWLYVYGHFPKNEIDHINRVRDDNRIANLRDVTRAENMQNTVRGTTK